MLLIDIGLVNDSFIFLCVILINIFRLHHHLVSISFLIGVSIYRHRVCLRLKCMIDDMRIILIAFGDAVGCFEVLVLLLS